MDEIRDDQYGENLAPLDPPDDLVFDDVPAQEVVEVENEAEAEVEAEVETEAEAEETPEEVAEETQSQPQPVVEETPDNDPPEWVNEYVAATNAHFQNLRALIKYTKTKDEAINKLSNELQKYREDYCAKTFKPIGMAIISFREDCRKSLADILKYTYDAKKVDKYLDFLADDYIEMMSNVGIEEEDDEWLFNGSPVRQLEQEKALTFAKPFTELAVAEEEDPAWPVVRNADDLVAYLKTAEDGIKASLANIEVLDKCLKAYIEFSFNLEKNLVKVLVLPTIRTMICLGIKLKNLVDETRKELTEENCNEKYTQCLNFIISALEDVLLSGGITIDADGRDTFDPKKDRLLKAVTTDDESLDRKLAYVHTECYIMNERIIYPSKVDVYKFVPKAEEN